MEIEATQSTTQSSTPVPSVSFRQAMVDRTAYTENGAISLSTTQPVGMDESVHGRMAFFFKAVRSLLKDESQLYAYLARADAENVRDALVLCFHLRNCRSKNGGKGERDLFRRCVEWYKENGKDHLIEKNLSSVVELGRWDDVLFCPGGHLFMAKQLLADFEVTQKWAKSRTEMKVDANPSVSSEEEKEKRPAITLAAKWAPSACMKNKKSRNKHIPMIQAVNEVLRTTNSSLFGRRVIREREYRKMLSTLREHLVVLERLMCSNKWELVDFNHVPSNAMHLYGKLNIVHVSKSPVSQKRKRSHRDRGNGREGAFMRHCKERFVQWREALKTGKTEDGKVAKVNASQLFPHEVVSQYLSKAAMKPDALVEAQWEVLERELKAKGSLKGCLFVADVSGSMQVEASPGSNTRCLDVAVALSLLGARCSEGKFKDLVMTFSTSPCFFDISSGQYLEKKKEERPYWGVYTPMDVTLNESKYDPSSLFLAAKRLESMDWGGGTDLQAVFDLILERGIKYKVDVSEMPKAIVIVSDMEWNSVTSDQHRSLSNFEAIKKKYKTAGYQMPTLVFWNVRSSSDTRQFPVAADESGTILLSGYSSSIMKELMTDGFVSITPYKVMRQVIDSDTYKNIVV
jgi:hypothetical protein